MGNGKGWSPINTDAIVAGSQQAAHPAQPSRLLPGRCVFTWRDCAQRGEGVEHSVSSS